MLCNQLQSSYSYPLCRNLRKTTHAKLLANLCFALMGLYATFIVSTVSTTVPVLCGLASALLHYFFLAVFFWMAAEAIHLHRKLVTVFKPDIKRYLYIAMAICWGELIGTEGSMSGVYALLLHNVHLLFLPYCSCSGSFFNCGSLLCSTLPELYSPAIVSTTEYIHGVNVKLNSYFPLSLYFSLSLQPAAAAYTAILSGLVCLYHLASSTS